jgi:surfeit locus 1 family protein
MRRTFAHARRTVRSLASSAGESGGSSRRAGGVVLFGGMVATTLYLGTWQTRRYFWKTQLIEEREASLRRAPAALPSTSGPGTAAAVAEANAFRLLTVRGVLDHDREVKVGPRSPPKHTAAHDDPLCEKNGFCIVTPLRRTGGAQQGERVLVHRGWVPKSALDAGKLDRPAGEVELSVVVLASEEQGRFTPDNEVASGHFFWLDTAALAQRAGIADGGVLVQTVGDGASNWKQQVWPLAKPVAALTDFYVTREKHAGYAATWYSLAFAGALMSVRLLR